MLYKEYDYQIKGKIIFAGMGLFMTYLVPWLFNKAMKADAVKLKGIPLGEQGSQIFLWGGLIFCAFMVLGCLYAFIKSFQTRKIIIKSGEITLPKNPLSSKVVTVKPEEILSQKIQLAAKNQIFIAKTKDLTIKIPKTSLKTEKEFTEVIQFISGQYAS